jgi:cell division protein FtsZ
MSLDIELGAYMYAKIKVIGIGGAGNNAINRMIDKGLGGAEFIAVNTDMQALNISKAGVKIQIGEQLTSGLGSGGDPSTGFEAAQESKQHIKDAVVGADLVFIAAGLGGGTGTGAAPVIAELVREMNILSVAVVTLPFKFEGGHRMDSALVGHKTLMDVVDTIVTIPNEKLSMILPKGTPLVECFKKADDVLRQGVQGITDLISRPGMINLDFADVKKVLSKRGVAHMGIGDGTGENKMMEAIKIAIESPLLDTNIRGASGVLLNVIGDDSISLTEIQDAAQIIQKTVHPKAHIFFGTDTDSSMTDEVQITVIATGFDDLPAYDDEEGMLNGMADNAHINVGIENAFDGDEAGNETDADETQLFEADESVQKIEEAKNTIRKKAHIDFSDFEDGDDLDVPIFARNKKVRNITFDSDVIGDMGLEDLSEDEDEQEEQEE